MTPLLPFNSLPAQQHRYKGMNHWENKTQWH